MTATTEAASIIDNTAANERAVLGALMRSPKAFERVRTMLTGDDFYEPRHQSIWDAAVAVADAGAEPDPTAVITTLAERGDLAATGGTDYVLGMWRDVQTTSNAGWYAARVLGAAQNRRMVAAGTRLVQAGQGVLGAEDRVAVLADAASALEEITGTTASDPMAMLGESTLNDVLGAFEAPADAPRVRTGLTEVDELVRGWSAGQLIVAAGRPGAGKSVFAQHVLEHVARTVGPVLLITMEMSRVEVMSRLVSSVCRVPSQRANLEAPELTDDDWRKIATGIPELTELPILVCDEEKVSPSRVSALVGQAKRRHPDLALVVVDYLGLMDADGRHSNDQEKVASISRDLKRLARRHEVPLLALHQLNRQSTQRADRRPEMSDLRSSGAVEQDANQVILLHREDQYEAETPLAGEMEIHVAKNRGGRTGRARVAAQLHYYRLSDLGAGAHREHAAAA